MRLQPLLLVPLLLALPAPVAKAQTPATTPAFSGATVSGVVRDSIGRAPLAGAIVQLVSADGVTRAGRTVMADSLGRFTIADVPDGRYALGFFHPMLDSLGLEPTLREVSVGGRQPVRADLATPSPARLRGAICGAAALTDSSGVVVGVVREARDGEPAAGTEVIGTWNELSFTATGLVRTTPRLVATTKEKGWFALCGVPSAGLMALSASRGSDSTDVIDLQVPADGFLRHDLYLGAAQTTVSAAPLDTAARADTLAPAPRRLRTGDGRLAGTVVSAVERQPLAGARVGIAGGPQTRANERGEWTLVNVPGGTRTLEVRAVGYYPQRRSVNVVAGAPPVRVALSTLKAVLDTVRVTAARVRDRHRSGFEDRRRTGHGRYITLEDIARRNPVVTSDLFRTIPGLRVDRAEFGDVAVSMRGTFSERCAPNVYIDGQYMPLVGAEDIDSWVRPEDISAIEVYAGTSVPPQFQQGLSGCGSIVIWTK
jgi:hypothetical protein